MGGYSYRRTVYHGIKFHYDYECVWAFFPAVSLYCHCTGSSCVFCRRADTECRKKFYEIVCGGCLEGAVIVLACIIFSVFAASLPVVDADAAAVTMVWSYIGELIFNMLVLVGAVKMADRVVREMMGL